MKESTVPMKQEERQVAETREETRTLIPPVDIFETEAGLAVVADMPGVAKEQVEVHVENDLLTLKGSSKTHMETEPLHREYELRNYFRQFQLSDSVDQEKIKAEMRNGVLIIRLPKKEAKKPKQIAVEVA